MGFFSHRCAISSESIPACPYSGFNESESQVVLVLPNNEKIEGIYDGYGHICSDTLDPNTLDMPNFMNSIRDALGLSFEDYKQISIGDMDICRIDLFNYATPLNADHFIDGNRELFNYLVGYTMNELKAISGHRVTTQFNEIMSNVKMVKKKYYNNESFDELPVSPNCEYQGYFYPENFNIIQDALDFTDKEQL